MGVVMNVTISMIGRGDAGHLFFHIKELPLLFNCIMMEESEYMVQYLVIGDLEFKRMTYRIIVLPASHKDQVAQVFEKLKGILYCEKLSLQDIIVTQFCEA